jgi:hypothetical protein
MIIQSQRLLGVMQNGEVKYFSFQVGMKLGWSTEAGATS